MIADARVDPTHGCRRALWLVVYAVVLHVILCPAPAGATVTVAQACVAAPASAPEASPLRAAEAGPCAPLPHPHRPPCGAVTHAQPRTVGSWQAGVGAGCPLPSSAVGEFAGPRPACPGSSRPPAARAGAGLLIDLCASRT
jgi:hypothetical protein